MRSLNELYDLNGKTALVTGGAGYLGIAMCESLLELGATVIIASRKIESNSEKVEKLINEYSTDKVKIMQVDLMVKESIIELVSKIDRLDILVNNAWSGKKNSFETIDDIDWEYDIDMSLNSVFRLIKASIDKLKESSGVILNITSMYGHLAPDYRMYNEDEYVNPPSYGAAKAGVIQFTKYLASFLSPYGIRVNALSPGSFPHEATKRDKVFIDRLSAKNPLNRVGEPEDLKGIVAYLCSDASNYMTGQNICVDGGWGVW